MDDDMAMAIALSLQEAKTAEERGVLLPSFPHLRKVCSVRVSVCPCVRVSRVSHRLPPQCAVLWCRGGVGGSPRCSLLVVPPPHRLHDNPSHHCCGQCLRCYHGAMVTAWLTRGKRH